MADNSITRRVDLFVFSPLDDKVVISKKFEDEKIVVYGGIARRLTPNRNGWKEKSRKLYTIGQSQAANQKFNGSLTFVGYFR